MGAIMWMTIRCPCMCGGSGRNWKKTLPIRSICLLSVDLAISGRKKGEWFAFIHLRDRFGRQRKEKEVSL